MEDDFGCETRERIGSTEPESSFSKLMPQAGDSGISISTQTHQQSATYPCHGLSEPGDPAFAGDDD